MSLFSAEKVSELNHFWREMAPVPGRMEATLRFALAAALATLLLLILQPPAIYIAPALFLMFLVSRETPYRCFKDLVTALSGCALGTAVSLLLVIVTGCHPVARVLGLAVFTFLAAFFFRASIFPIAALPFGSLAYMVTSLWEYPMRPEKVLHLSLWGMGALTTAAGSLVAVEYLLNRNNPLLALRREIKARCAALERLFQLCAARAEAAQIEKQSALVRRYAVTGRGRLHVLLESIAENKDCSRQDHQKIATITLMLDRLLVLGAAFALHKDFEKVDPARLERIGRALAAAGKGSLEQVIAILGDAPSSLPRELEDFERTLRHAAESLESGTTISSRALPSKPKKFFLRSLLAPDALTNPDYLFYSLKLSLCATICYVIYNGLRWPGISTAYFTVLFTGLSTTGASNRKLLFRALGSTLGGLILGIGCLVFVFPNLEGVQGFLLVIAALTFLAAWIGTSPYFGYIGLQTAFSFYLLAFEQYRAPDQMTPARDRLLGIALGFIVMFFIFHQVRPERTVDTMRRLLARLLRTEAELVCCLEGELHDASSAKVVQLRNQIESLATTLQALQVL